MVAEQERGLVPAGLDPGQIERGFAAANLALIRANDDPEWLWNSARAAAIYAQVWAGHAEKRDEMEAAQLICEIQLGQVLGPNPGDDGKGPGKSLYANIGIPRLVVHDLRHFHGYADPLMQAVLGSLEHSRRVISRRALVALAADLRQRADANDEATQTAHPMFAYDIRQGDFREVLADLDGTVDAIITDPPYPRQYLPLYGDLARFAAKALKPGGSLVCMTGQAYLPDVLAALRSELAYRWTLAYMVEGPHIQVWPPRILNGWKPVLWLTNGPTAGPWRYDVVESPTPRKSLHPWEQTEGGTNVLVERFTAGSDLVCDPFVGSGTTGVVAVRSGRRFVGAEIDAEHAARAERRIRSEAVRESTRENGDARPGLLEMAPLELDGSLHR